MFPDGYAVHNDGKLLSNKNQLIELGLVGNTIIPLTVMTQSTQFYYVANIIFRNCYFSTFMLKFYTPLAVSLGNIKQAEWR